MEVPRIQTDQSLASNSVGEIELVGSDRIALRADAEKLALNCDLVMAAIGGAENLIERGLQSLPRSKPVGGRVFVSIRNPDVHDRRAAQFGAHMLADPATGDAVVDPELANGAIGMAERKVLRAPWMRKAGGVEIEPKILLSRPVNPTLEMRRLDGITLHAPFGFEIDSVKIEAMPAGNERKRNFKIGTEFRRSACTARIIARGLDPARQIGIGILEAENIVTLPALDRNRNGIQDGQYGVRADALLRKPLSREFVSVPDSLFRHLHLTPDRALVLATA